jgi:hypothetical protein
VLEGVDDVKKGGDERNVAEAAEDAAGVGRTSGTVNGSVSALSDDQSKVSRILFRRPPTIDKEDLSDPKKCFTSLVKLRYIVVVIPVNKATSPLRSMRQKHGLRM